MTALLTYPPVRDNYNFTPGNGKIVVKLQGGSSLMRSDKLGSEHTVSMSWILDEKQYTEFMGFFRSDLQESSLPFLVDLVTDLSIPNRHRARVVDQPRLTAQRGNAFYVSADVIVEANPTYTGSILFTVNTGGGIDPTIDTAPHKLPEFIVGDQFRLHRTNPTSPNTFDGVYLVTSKPTDTSLRDNTFVLGGTVWNVMNPGSISTPGTITRIPT